MATIVFGGALSHSPLMNFPIAKDHGQVAKFQAAVDGLKQRLLESAPDIVMVFGPDHFRALFYDLMPAFVISVGVVKGCGDWNTPRGPFATNREFAGHVLQGLLDEGFAPAFSHDIQVDHGITQPLQLLNIAHLPVLPVLINAAGPPLPPPGRCYEFGAAVGRAIAAFPKDLRIAVLASGGLSHDPPAPSEENAIHGRINGFAESRDRETSLMKKVDALQARINPEWDRMVLRHFEEGAVQSLAAGLTGETIFNEAGNGGQEIRTWIAAAGALGDPKMRLLSYEPIQALMTGMGVIST